MIAEIKSYDDRLWPLTDGERKEQAGTLFRAATDFYESLPPIDIIISMDGERIQEHKSAHLIYYRFGAQPEHGSALIHSHGQEVSISWSPTNLTVRVVNPTLETFQRIPEKLREKMMFKSSSGGIFSGNQVRSEI